MMDASPLSAGVTHFFDNDIAPAIPEAQRVLRQEAVHIVDCGQHGLSAKSLDVEWMPKVGILMDSRS